ncbi:MAG TPA: cupin domain-containing protein [Longimicrobiales bacterium]|nr:cupin domain-containing protein [Longimicrobiales bacterium]
MKSFSGNIEDQTESNRDFRRVIYTGPHIQLVLMSLEPGEELGEEVHTDTDQFFRFEKGEGEAVIDGQATRIEDDDAIVIPAGTRHNIRNTGEKHLKFYTLYAPPHHPEGTVHHTKAAAESAAEHAG